MAGPDFFVPTLGRPFTLWESAALMSWENCEAERSNFDIVISSGWGAGVFTPLVLKIRNSRCMRRKKKAVAASEKGLCYGRSGQNLPFKTSEKTSNTCPFRFFSIPLYPTRVLTN
jgi:hypothetical protein